MKKIAGLILLPCFFFVTGANPVKGAEFGYHQFPKTLSVKDCINQEIFLFHKEKPTDFANSSVATEKVTQVVYAGGEDSWIFFDVRDGSALGAYPYPFECKDYPSLLLQFTKAMKNSLKN